MTTSALDSETPAYIIRVCSSRDDFAACIDLQRRIWQFSDLDITPPRAYLIARHNGGVTLGAFGKDGRVLGFAHALPAFDENNRPYYYSQMTAVDRGAQNAGIGYRLKLAQRDYALRRGIPLISWTFDPLQSRNAHLNLVKLGGVVRAYHVNRYGDAPASVLDRGLETDRLVLEWWIGSEHVARALAGEERRDAPVAAVEIPGEIEQMQSGDLSEGRRWQLEVRAAFQRRLAEGLYCTDFRRGEAGGRSQYLFFEDGRCEVELRYR